MLVDIEGHGRDDSVAGLDVTGTVGWFTVIVPRWLDLPADLSPADAINRVVTARQAVPGNGIGYAATRYVARYPALTALPEAKVAVNYLGRDSAATTGLRLTDPAPAPSRSPGNRRPHRLAISAWISGGRLTVDVAFCVGVDRSERIQELSRLLLGRLRELGAALSGGSGQDGPLPADQLADLRSRYGNIEGVYPLTAPQEGILYHELLDDEAQTYLVQAAWAVANVPVDTLRRAWTALVATHPVLRTAVVWDGLDQPVQVVLPDVAATVSVTRVDGTRDMLPDEDAVAEDLARRRATPLRLDRAPLTRLAVTTGYRDGADEVSVLVWELHHIVLDGWSTAMLWQEFLDLVVAERDGTVALVPTRPPYRDFVAWCRAHPDHQYLAEWRRYLRGFDRPTPLPLGEARNAGTGLTDHRCALDAATSAAVARSAREQRVTRHTQVLAAWALVLATAASGDVVFGTVVAGRPVDLPGVETMVGLFINTVPVRVAIPDGGSVGDWLRGLQAEQADMAAAQHMPLRTVLSVSEVPRTTSLFQSLVIYQNYPERQAATGLRIWPLGSVNHTNYPATLVVSTTADGRINWRLTVDESRVDSRMASVVADRFGQCLVALTSDDLSSLRSVVGQEDNS